MRAEDEPMRASVAKETLKPRHGRKLDADMPRGTAGKEGVPLFWWQFGDGFQIHLDGGGERRSGLIEGCALDRDVEIDAERLPLRSATIGVALKLSFHANAPRHHVTRVPSGARFCQYGLPSALTACKPPMRMTTSIPGETLRCRMG